MNQPSKNINKLNILQWNIQGLRSKTQELNTILSDKKIMIACLQETLLEDTQFQPNRKFQIERSPHFANMQNRGVAILINNMINYSRIRLNTTLEAVAIRIHSIKTYTLCSIYLSPNMNIAKEDLKDIIKQLPAPFLLMGDFNAKHPMWDSNHAPDTRGRAIQDLLTEEPISLLNQGDPTHYHVQTNTFSTIDLCLCSVGMLRDFNLAVDADLHGSDHFPITLTPVDFLPQHHVPRWIKKKADWEEFSHEADTICSLRLCEAEEFYNKVEEKIRSAALKAIPKSDGYYKNSPVPWWNSTCENLKKERLRAQNLMTRHHTITNRINYKKHRSLFQRTQKDAQRSSWKTYVSTINFKTEESKVWRRIDKIKGKHCPKPLPIIKVNGTMITDPKEVANSFAQHFAAASVKSKNLYPTEHNRSKQKVKRQKFTDPGGHPDNVYLNAPFTMDDLQCALSQCGDTSPGLDEITISMLNHMTISALTTLLQALNLLWETRGFPNQWNKEVKIPISKPNKNAFLRENHRGISLTSCICKLFERMVNRRLTWFLEKNKITCKEQSGSRKGRSTSDALTQLTSYIETGFSERKHTTAVFFDLEKAYDTVWRSEIMDAVYKMGLRGNLPIFLQNFLKTREFCVRVGATHSDFVSQNEGLPQGSVLSVTLFAIAINDITKQLGQDVQCTLYVDDFTIFKSAINEAHSTRAIQTTINRLENWTKTKGMIFSSEKTVAMKFEKRRKGYEPHLTLRGGRITTKDSTTYLGLVLDKRLNWRNHVEHLRAKCASAVNMIKHLSHLSWGADRQTLLHLYTALVKSKLDYGAEVYGRTTSGVLKRLDPIQNACLRACTGAFKSSPAVSLCTEAGLPPLEYSRDEAILKQFFKMNAYPNTPVYQTVIKDGSPQLEYIKSLLDKYEIGSPKVWPHGILQKPSWCYPSIKICPSIQTGKINQLPIDLRNRFMAHKDTHKSKHHYTDGSKTEEGVGYAIVSPDKTTKGRITAEGSVFTAELYALREAINNILRDSSTKNHTVFSDSQSALMALASYKTRSPLVESVRRKYYQAIDNDINLELCWVPSHTDIAGNEKADTAAKEAASLLEPHSWRAIPHTDMKRPIRKAVREKWKQRWNDLDNFPKREGRKLREIKKDVGKWKSSFNSNRRTETVLARLRIGHTNMTHAYLMQGQSNPPLCDTCNVPITVKHMLVECRKFNLHRNKYYTNPTLADILAESNSFSVNKLVNFLKDANLFHLI
ncbi:MAG: reverse transcriptase domain-containing protein [Cyanobacteria bacterium J06614_10]